MLNSFQTPNFFTDEILYLLTSDEWRVLSFAVRHILGWQDKINKRQGQISLTAFVDGFTFENGKHFHGCGLSRPTVVKVLESLASFGLLVPQGKATSKGQMYELPENEDTIKIDDLLKRHDEKQQKDKNRTAKIRAKKEVVNDINQSIPLTSNGKCDLPEVVNDINTTNTSKRQNKRQDSSARKRDLLFDCIKEHLFILDADHKCTRSEGALIGEVTSDLRKKYAHVPESDLIDRLLRWIENWKETHPPDINLPLASAKVLKHFGKWYDDMGFDLTWKSYIPKKIVRQEDYPS